MAGVKRKAPEADPVMSKLMADLERGPAAPAQVRLPRFRAASPFVHWLPQTDTTLYWVWCLYLSDVGSCRHFAWWYIQVLLLGYAVHIYTSGLQAHICYRAPQACVLFPEASAPHIGQAVLPLSLVCTSAHPLSLWYSRAATPCTLRAHPQETSQGPESQTSNFCLS